MLSQPAALVSVSVKTPFSLMGVPCQKKEPAAAVVSMMELEEWRTVRFTVYMVSPASL